MGACGLSAYEYSCVHQYDKEESTAGAHANIWDAIKIREASNSEGSRETEGTPATLEMPATARTPETILATALMSVT
jgi:hypothetical protein